MGILYFFVMRADSDSLAPVLLLAYGVATGPISWMAQKESQHGGGEFAVISSLFAQIAFIAVVAVAFIVAWPFFDLALLFAAIMGVGLLFQYRLAFLNKSIKFNYRRNGKFFMSIERIKCNELMPQS